jgi:hypothetical protein
MLIQKFCVRNPDDQCTQCRCRLRKKRRLCPVFKGMAKSWAEVYEYIRGELDRLTEENEKLKQQLTFARRRASRNAPRR